MSTLWLVQVSDILGGTTVLDYFITRRSEYFTSGHNVVILCSGEEGRYVLCCGVFPLQMASFAWFLYCGVWLAPRNRRNLRKGGIQSVHVFQMCLAISVPDRRSSHQPRRRQQWRKRLGGTTSLLNYYIIAFSAAVQYLFDKRLSARPRETSHTTMQYTILTPIHTGPKKREQYHSTSTFHDKRWNS